tara:strand:- start:420 stop:605 length:186 start_codon:yes stop_codon:yes gene_type:complete
MSTNLAVQEYIKRMVGNYSERLEICNSCDELRKSIKQCKICGCFVVAKTAMPSAKCPIDKW